jgi:hypothetical protein
MQSILEEQLENMSDLTRIDFPFRHLPQAPALGLN